MTRKGLRLGGAIAPLLLGVTAFGQDLQSDLERIYESSPASGATTSWFVAEVDGDPGIPGEVLASHESEAALIPASNMKLITSGAALHVLGPDYTFRTEMGLSGTSLVVRGMGDPALADPALLERMSPPMTVDDVLDVLAGAVVDAGVSEVDALVLDDRVFEREGVHETWPRDQLDKQYCAQVSGLNFHTNVLRVFVAPGTGEGSSATISTQPSATWLRLANRTRTAARGTNQIWPTRAEGTNDFTVHGQVVRKSYYPLEVTVHEPARFLGDLLAERLRDRGIDVAEVRLARDDETLDLDRVLARITTNIDDVLARCNQDSRNLYAESLLKLLGHRITGEPGSWRNGPTVIRMLISQIVSPEAAAATVVADGSGMSRDNLVSTRLLCAWLEAMAEDDRIAEAFLASLAVPGTGTLRNRFVDGARESELDNAIFAKSGYLNGVRSLSGYLAHPGGRMVAFSFIINDISPSVDAKAKRLIDDCVREIDAYLTATAGAAASHPGG